MATISEVSIVPHVGYSSVDYLTDYLGSVVGLTNEKGNASSIRRFKPSGSLLSGTAVTPFTFGWTGNTGSRYTGLINAEQYNRARHPSTRTLQWTTRDPLWPEEHAYGYVGGNPLSRIDPLGLRPKRRLEFIPIDRDIGWFWICMSDMKRIHPKMHPQERCFACKQFTGIEIDCFTPQFFGPGTKYGPDIGKDFPIAGGGINFRYGNYCGKYNVKQGLCKPPPINCIDTCCNAHDDCLGPVDYFSPKGTECNCTLAECAERCLKETLPTGHVYWATKEVLETFHRICALGKIINYIGGSSTAGAGGSQPRSYTPKQAPEDASPGTNVGTHGNPRYV